MKITAKVRNYGKGRKIIEIPKAVRNNFKDKEEVEITKHEVIKDEWNKCNPT